jgi:8-oxo-dGTP pyrophosphatase MutT (NUDIX family)
MTDWAIHRVDPDVRVRVVRPMPKLPADLDAAVEAMWEQARAGSPGLFNGRVFSADLITPGLICGHWTEFRRVVAQMRQPALHARLGVRALAVGGVIACPDGVVFGRRPRDAVYQAGEWQLPPAGSVDPTALRAEGAVDVVAALLTELTEELGLPVAAMRDARPLCIVEHAVSGVGSHVLDMGVSLTTDWTAAAIRARHEAAGNGEYDPLEIVPLAALPAFLAERAGALNGQARVFLERAGLLAA